MDGNDHKCSRFGAFRWCSSSSYDDEEEKEVEAANKGDDRDIVNEDEKQNNAMLEEYFGEMIRRAVEQKLMRGEKIQQLVECFSNQRSLLKRITGREEGDGGFTDPCENGDRRALVPPGYGRLGKRRYLDLNNKVSLVMVYHPHCHFPSIIANPRLRRPLFFDMAFAYDLLGCLRRYHHSTRTSTTTPQHVRISARFLSCFGGDRGDAKDLLQEMLLKCIANLPHMEKFHVAGDNNVGVPYQKLLPVLQPKTPSRPDHLCRTKRECGLRELRLENLCFANERELMDFASFFEARTTRTLGRNRKWDNLESLELRDMSVSLRLAFRQTRRIIDVSLDPIFGAIAGRDDDDKDSDNHLPRLDTFRLTLMQPPRIRGVTLCRYHLDDDRNFIRLLNKPSLKHIAFAGFIQPRHCRLMRLRLSRRGRNIEVLELSARDLCGRYHRDNRGSKREYTTEESVLLNDAMQCLLMLVRANPSMRHLTFGEDFERQENLKQDLRRTLHDIAVWTALNRNGMKHFLVGESSLSSYFSWTLRENIEFLIRLGTRDRSIIGYNGDFTDTMTLDALFLSLWMRPDLCHRSEAGVKKVTERTVGTPIKGMHQLTD